LKLEREGEKEKEGWFRVPNETGFAVDWFVGQGYTLKENGKIGAGTTSKGRKTYAGARGTRRRVGQDHPYR